MPICKCCQPLRDALGEPDKAFSCDNSTPTVNGKRFAIQSRTRRFCRIDMDLLMAADAKKCDFAFAACPEDTLTDSLQDENGDHREKYEPWYFIELAGDSKSSEDCYEQLKASILQARRKGVLRGINQRPIVEGYVIGSKPASRRKNKASDTMRTLKNRFVEKDKLGRKLEFLRKNSYSHKYDD